MFLQVDQLSLTLEGKEILKDVTFGVEEGSMTLIAGRNGSGKSMLFKCLKGLERPGKGAITLNGREIRKRKDKMKAFALVFQDTNLEVVGSTVERDIAFGLENIGLGKDEIKRKVDEMLAFFSLEGQRDVRPTALSGGELRKLAIAGVLAMEPDVLLLDEPFANLDYPSTLKVIRTLDSLRERRVTVLIVSHEAEKFLSHTDNTIIMEKGRIASHGRSKDMLKELSEHDIFIPAGAVFEDLSWL